MKKIQKACLSARQGFTLIELLIVIAIIGILAGVILVSTSSARNKALGSNTKQTLSSLKTAITSCCAGAEAGVSINTAAAGGGDVCSTALGVTYPTAVQLGGTAVTYTGTTCAVADPTVTVALTGHPVAACNATWTISVFGAMTIPAGC